MRFSAYLLESKMVSEGDLLPGNGSGLYVGIWVKLSLPSSANSSIPAKPAGTATSRHGPTNKPIENNTYTVPG
ncbi:hypothetical protein UR09_03340 [Candidatus Nitromaritima sp. SCGC AAA799-A02]|nr:hypothetical protein UR09_03340 [Candidatus Nitromaritima sp. SCGC AAA799-A02]